MKMKMQLPGFTAESALVKAKGVYASYGTRAAGGGGVAPAFDRGCGPGYQLDPKTNECVMTVEEAVRQANHQFFRDAIQDAIDGAFG